MCDNMIIDQFHSPKIVARKVMAHYFICSRKIMVHLTVQFRYAQMGLPRPVVILLMEWVCGYRGAWKLLDLLLGSWPAGETVCLAEPRAVLLGCSPPTVAATCLSCCAFLHTVISRADLYGSNQATSVVNPMTFKTQSGKKCRTHFLSEGFLQTCQLTGLS